MTVGTERAARSHNVDPFTAGDLESWGGIVSGRGVFCSLIDCLRYAEEEPNAEDGKAPDGGDPAA
jgi:hypothetical protein